ncbi:MAG: hypothetical protein ACJZ69_04275 [Pelagibacteraceae bacterium]
MEVLKNSEKFSVFKIREKNKNIILKIAHKDPKKILREVKLLKKLSSSSIFFKSKIPKIINFGLVKKGLSKNKGFYKQDFIKGLTFSQIIQTQKISKKNLGLLIKTLINQFLLITREKKLISKKKNSLNYIKKTIRFEFNKIKKRRLLLNLINSKIITIDGEEYKDIKFYLEGILNSRVLKKLINHHFLAEIGHWNFHGGNIIFPSNKKFGKFHLIDPDATWNFNDPFFSLSRFIYTYPHDTMEFDKYSIYSENFRPGNNKDEMNFKCKILWKKEILRKYNVAFNKFFAKDLKANPLFKNLNELEFLRYNLTIILCFIRGINSNYEQKINFLNKKSSIFQNKSIYLYLLTLKRLKSFKNFLDKKYE